jgi:hypothetical protein
MDENIGTDVEESLEEAAVGISTPIPTRAIVVAALRAVLFIGILLLIYTLLPLNQSPGTSLAVVIGCSVGLVIFVGIFIRRLRAITRSPHPLVTAGEALVEVLAVFIVLFALIHLAIADSAPASYTERLDHVAAFYFAVTVLTTVGFGDIAPVTNSARIATTIQMIADLFLVATAARMIISVARRSESRHRHEQPAPRPSADPLD